MRNPLLIITISLIFSSCATVLKRKTYPLIIQSNELRAKVKVYDSIYDLPAKVLVMRSKENLSATLIFDETYLAYQVVPRLNKTFIWWNLVGMQLAPLNYAIDFSNQKRFTYGNQIYLDSHDSLRLIGHGKGFFSKGYFKSNYPQNKGAINVVLSAPLINAFFLNTKDYGKQSNIGFLGVSAGLEYFYKNRKYISINASIFSEIAPFYPYIGSEDLFVGKTLSVTDNFKFNRVNVGYGLNFELNQWDFDVLDYNNPVNDYSFNLLYTIKQNSRSFGLRTDVYFQLTRYSFMGLVYRPSIYKISPVAKFDYEHTFSLDLIFKIPVKKK